MFGVVFEKAVEVVVQVEREVGVVDYCMVMESIEQVMEPFYNCLCHGSRTFDNTRKE